MKKPKALIFSGYGLNCEEETKYAFILAGASADIVHVNDIIDRMDKLSYYQIVAFPGGFAYGDDMGSGNAYAQKVKNHLWKEITSFIKKDKLVIGICNGFQILVNLGLLPALKFQYGTRETALLPNTSARYSNRWVDMKVTGSSPWLTGIKTMSFPIAHGEGKFHASDAVLKTLQKKHLIAARYCSGEMCEYLNLPANPNGALDDIAGITDESGRIFGLMPHPDRAIFFTQLPNWPLKKEMLRREGKEIPQCGPGLQIFQNAVKYFTKQKAYIPSNIPPTL